MQHNRSFLEDTNCESVSGGIKMNCQINKKAIVIAAGTIGGITLLGIVAAMIYNSKQMKAMRVAKRASHVMYHVGTAMRNLSGEAENM